MKIQSEESVILFLVVWTVTEITRYSYYTFNLLHHLPYFIKWARWSRRCTETSLPFVQSELLGLSMLLRDAVISNPRHACKSPALSIP